MRYVIIIAFISISSTIYGQNSQIIGHITNRDTIFATNFWTILLMQRDSTIKKTATNFSGNFRLKDIDKGIYSLTIQQIGFRDYNIDSLQILTDTTLNLYIDFPPPCKFVYLTYLKHQKPKCINGGHTNNIIPIVYGLPSQKTMRKAKKGLVHLAGCIISACDPHYYCTIHKIELWQRRKLVWQKPTPNIGFYATGAWPTTIS